MKEIYAKIIFDSVGVILIMAQYFLIPFEEVVEARIIMGPMGWITMFPLFMGMGILILVQGIAILQENKQK